MKSIFYSMIMLTFAFVNLASAADTQVSCRNVINKNDQLFLTINSKNDLEKVFILNLGTNFGEMNGFDIFPVPTDVQLDDESIRYELLLGSGYFLDVKKTVLNKLSGQVTMLSEYGGYIIYSCRQQ